MALRIWNRIFPKVKTTVHYEYPTRCPEGHSQISWVSEEKNVHCWLCDKEYPISECVCCDGESQQTGGS